MDEVVELTRKLVTIPSHRDETDAGDAIESWLRDHTDAAVTRDDVGNVIARRGPDGPSLALVGHHDVVAPHERQLEDGEPTAEVRDGRVYGRGTADMKGAVAAMMLAFRDADPETELMFASFVGEETGGEGAQFAVETGVHPDAAVIGEGSARYAGEDGLDVVVAHRGRRGSTVTARGQSTHASDPDTGINAIYRAVDAIGRLRAIDVPRATVAGYDLEGSLEITQIHGGSTMNVIPDRCTITIDERTVPGERVAIEQTIDDLEGVSWEVDQDWPPMLCNDDGFAARTVEALASVQTRPPEQVVKPHATDASWLAEAGTATVVIGPAERGEAHTEDESVDIDLLHMAMDGYRAIAEHWSGDRTV